MRRASDPRPPPPYRQFMVGCQNPAIEEHSKRTMILVAWSQNPAIEEHSKRPMILAACYEEPPVEGHPEGNWALIDLVLREGINLTSR